MPSTPLVSVVTPVYNGYLFLRECIESVSEPFFRPSVLCECLLGALSPCRCRRHQRLNRRMSALMGSLSLIEAEPTARDLNLCRGIAFMRPPLLVEEKVHCSSCSLCDLIPLDQTLP